MPAFDAFISYSRADQDAVLAVADALRDRGIKPFLDRWHLTPGKSWPELLEQNLANCGAVIVFVGPKGLGGWQKREIYKALDRQVGDDMPVIPVLLPGTEDPALGFLSLNTWVDLRAGLLDDAALDALVGAVRGQPPGPVDQDARADICPYRGLEPFREEDAPFFFGRQSFTDVLLDRVERHNLVAVVGASGSGKSSVVRAGLTPALRKTTDVVWDIETFVPGAEPLQAMVRTFDPPDPDLGLIEYRAQLNAAANLLRHGQVTLAQLATEFLANQPGTERLLLVIDQFEELVTLCESDQDRTVFIDQVLQATAQDGPLKVIITLRSDFYTEFVRRRDFADRIQDGIVNIGPLRRDVDADAPPGTLSELEETVIRPAQEVGLDFEEGLVARILDDVGDEPGRLPLLEYLLTELWRRRNRGYLTHDAYDALGGVAGAITRRAEEAFAALDDDGKAAARRLFLSLVRPGEGHQDTRARAGFPDDPKTAEVARHFSNPKVRLLVTNRDDVDGRSLEVSHESLIRNWTTLQGWVDANRTVLRIRERVLDRMQQWEEADFHDDGLLPAGLDLEEGRRLLRQSGDVPVADVKEFVERSIAHHTAYKRKRARVRFLTVAGSIAAAFLMAISAGAAIWLRIDAVEAQRKAEQQEAIAKAFGEEADIERKRALAASAEAKRRAAEAKAAQAAAEEAKNKEVQRAVEAQVQKAIVKALYIKSGTFQARFRARQARDQARKGNHAAALRVAMEGMPGASTENAEEQANAETILALVPELPAILSSVLHSMRLKHLWRHAKSERLKGHDLSPDGRAVALVFANQILVRDLETGAVRKTFEGPEDDPFIRAPVYAPVGNLVAAVTQRGVIHIWRVDLGTLQTVIRLPTPRFGTMAFSPDGARLITTDFSVEATVWDVFTGTALRKIQHIRDPRNVLSTDRIRTAEFIGDGSRIMTRSIKAIRIWSRDPDAEALTIRTSGLRVAVAPDGNELISNTLSRATVFDARTGEQKQRINASRGQISRVVYAPDGQSFLIAGLNGKISVRSSENGSLMHRISANVSELISIGYSPDSQHIVGVHRDGSVWVWKAETGALAWRQASGDDLGVWDEQTVRQRTLLPAQSAVMSSDGKHIVTLSQRSVMRVWNADPNIGPRVLSQKPGGTPSVALSKDGAVVITATAGEVRLIDRETGRNMLDMAKLGRQSFTGPVAHSGTRLAFVGQSDSGVVFDALTSERRAVLPHDSDITAAAFAQDGQILMTATARAVRLWDSQTLKLLTEWSPGEALELIRSADIADDGARVAIATSRKVLVWHTDTGNTVQLGGDQGAKAYRFVRMSADGSMAVALSSDALDRFVLFDTQTGVAFLDPVAYNREIETLAFSRDGAFVLAGLRNGHLWVYETIEGTLIDRVAGHSDRLTSSAVSADGRFVATASRDGTVRIWRQYEDPNDLYKAAKQAMSGLDLLSPTQECALYLRLEGCW